MQQKGKSQIDLSKDDFQRIGYQLIDRIAEFLDTIQDRKVSPGEAPPLLQDLLGNAGVPEHGRSPEELLKEASEMIFSHSLLNGHPKFLGYITSSAAPLGALADLLAASVNPNLGSQVLSPIATEIEKQTIRWLAELIGLSPDCGGLLVSGGNMANLTAMMTAISVKSPSIIKQEGVAGLPRKLAIYCSRSTHTWIEKAAIVTGLGSAAIRWIETDDQNKMDLELLEQKIRQDLSLNVLPIAVVATAGDVSTGAVDDLQGIASICKSFDLWFHIDGAYGIPAAVVPEWEGVFKGHREADSIAMDPHKWLYTPLEAGCLLVRKKQDLADTFTFHPDYYDNNYDEEELTHNFHEYGIQNSRGFRALKVWLSLQQVGRKGFIDLIRNDIALSRSFYEMTDKHDELQAVSQNLSINTFRYMPSGETLTSDYLNVLNESLLNHLQRSGEVFLSNAIVDGNYCLRACIVNFRTTLEDLEEVTRIVVREGKKVHRALRSSGTSF